MMFKKVFGTDKKSIRKNCIILPLNDKSLFKPLVSGIYSRGMFYDVSYSEEYSVIYLKHMCFAGDCVLMMEDTACENIFVFGCCGGLRGEVGDKIVVKKSFNLESFSGFLNADTLEDPDCFSPDKRLMNGFLSFVKGKDYRMCACATVSSLVLEERNRELLLNLGIDCVDMECSMVFSAASRIGRKAMALFYVSDVVGKINFYDQFDNEARKKIKGSRKSIADRLIKFITHELS